MTSRDHLEMRAQKPSVLHFVNGGGGAYLSFGTSLAWPLEAGYSPSGV